MDGTDGTSKTGSAPTLKHRKLDGHKVNPANDRLEIDVLDEGLEQDAPSHYRVSGFEHPDGTTKADLKFQHGPIAEQGVNGVTQETLIEICIDRLRWFQKGPYACRENAIALTKLEEAQMWLQRRTRDRMKRGVEGTHVV